MSLIFVDGFGHYTSVTQKWPLNGADASIGTGRFGGSCMTSPFQNHGVARSLPSSYSTLIIGGAVSIGDYSGAQTPLWLGTGLGLPQVSLRVTSGGHLEVRSGGIGGTLLGTSAVTFDLSVFYYVELKVTFSTTVGSFELRINGVTQASGSGVNTSPQGGTTANTIGLGILGSNSGGGRWSVGDLYVCDGSGATNNDFLGDVRIETRFPSGAGSSAQFSRGGTDSGANWSQVDEAAPNDDTDYITDGTPGDIDSYAMADLATSSGIVYGVQVGFRARKDDAGSRSVRSRLKIGASVSTGPTLSLPSSFVDQFDVLETKPGGGGWTIADVNNLEIGMEVVS